MKYIKCPQFTDGGPAPSVWYADRLRESYREVCQFCKSRRRFKLSELEPLWHFCETMAVSRMFGVSRSLYDYVDQRVSRMGRGLLIKLALQAFLTPALSQYLQALESGAVGASDAVMFYLRLRATLDWMEDNTVLIDRYVEDLDVLLDRFRDVVDRNRLVLVERARGHSDIEALWRSVLSRADSRFVTSHYVKLV